MISSWNEMTFMFLFGRKNRAVKLESETEPAIYFRINQGYKWYEWFVINKPTCPPLLVTDDGTSFLTPCFPPQPKHHDRASCAVVGSTIYIVGGEKEDCEGTTVPKKDVFFIDCDNIRDGWKIGPPLNKARVQPCVVEFDRKLLVMSNGYSYRQDEETIPFAETFDPKVGWVVFRNEPPPKFPKKLGEYHAMDDDGRVLLLQKNGDFRCKSTLCTYDVEDGSCGNKFGLSFERPGSWALVDGILYSLSMDYPGEFSGFDVSDPLASFRIPVKFSNPPPVADDERPWLPSVSCKRDEDDFQNHFVLALGDQRLAILWSVQERSSCNQWRNYVWCSKWKMSKGGTQDKIELVASPISLNRYSIGEFHTLENCVIVGRKEVPKKEAAVEEKAKKASGSLLAWVREYGLRGDVAAGIIIGIATTASISYCSALYRKRLW